MYYTNGNLKEKKKKKKTFKHIYIRNSAISVIQMIRLVVISIFLWCLTFHVYSSKSSSSCPTPLSRYLKKERKKKKMQQMRTREDIAFKYEMDGIFIQQRQLKNYYHH